MEPMDGLTPPKPPRPDCIQIVIYDVDPALPPDVIKEELIHNNSFLHHLPPNDCETHMKDVQRLQRWNSKTKQHEASRSVKITAHPTLANPLLAASGLYLGSQVHYL